MASQESLQFRVDARRSAPPTLCYQSLVESMPLGVEHCDLQGRICYSNAAHHRLLGYPPGQLIGKSIWDFEVSDACRERLQRYFAQLIDQQPAPEPFFTKNRRHDGEIIDIRIDWTYDRDDSGQLCGFVAIIADVTELKRTEANLAAAQRIAHLGSWELDLTNPDARHADALRWSDEVFRIFGYEPGECTVSNENFYRAVHPDDRASVAEAVAACLSDHSPYKLEHRIVLPDGSERVVYEEGQIIRDQETGVPLKMLGIVQDITQRKLNEEAIRFSHARLKRVLDGIFAYVGLLTPEGVVIEVNRAPLEAAGLSREDVVGRPLVETYWLAHSERVRTALRDTLRFAASGKTIRRDLSIQVAEGNVVTVDAILSPLRNARGELTEIVASAVDVTQRREIERELQRLNEELEQRVAQRTAALNDKNQELEAFAHSVSHDLRAPLRAMEGFATALKEDFGEALGEEGAEFIEHIISSTKRMDVLIHDLLAYSRLGRKEICLEPVSLNTVIAAAVSSLRQEIEDSGAKLDLPNNLPVVRGHATLLLQSTTNLLSNAIKFVEAGDAPRIRIRAQRRPAGMVRLWIGDNGIGISAEHQDRVFKVFERLHGVESYPGTGIGLAIVRRACERLGGACGVESTIGKGSRFWIELPAGSLEGNTQP